VLLGLVFRDHGWMMNPRLIWEHPFLVGVRVFRPAGSAEAVVMITASRGVRLAQAWR